MSAPIDPTDYKALARVYFLERFHQPGLLAVARAVLPEGYVAVPVEALVKLSDSVSALKHVTSGVAMRNNVRVITCRIDALIPTEATDDTD